MDKKKRRKQKIKKNKQILKNKINEKKEKPTKQSAYTSTEESEIKGWCMITGVNREDIKSVEFTAENMIVTLKTMEEKINECNNKNVEIYSDDQLIDPKILEKDNNNV